MQDETSPNGQLIAANAPFTCSPLEGASGRTSGEWCLATVRIRFTLPCMYVDGHQVFHLDPADPLQVGYKHLIGHEPTGQDHPELLRYGSDVGHSRTIVDHI